MKIYRGIVVDNVDTSKRGIMYIKNTETNENNIPIKYTSPFFMRNEGGIMAIPEIGSEILYVEEDKGDLDRYYLCTKVDFPYWLGSLNERIGKSLVPNKRHIFSKEGVPQAIAFKDTNNAGLIISNLSDKEDGIRVRTELRSQGNHRAVLSDDPGNNAVMIKNSDGDGITITTKSDTRPSNSIISYSFGPQRCVVDESDFKVIVLNGTDITLKNFSYGDNAPPGAPRKSGNVNIESSYRDINIYTAGADGNDLETSGGNIFIKTEANKSIIQINSSGKINIYSKGDINVQSDGNINFKAGNNLNLEGKNVNIKSSDGGKVQIKSESNLKIQSVGEASIKGDTIQLNNPNDSGVDFTGVVIPEKEIDAYGR